MSALVQSIKVHRTPYETQKAIDGTITDEIVIALCGPMGTPLHPVAETFQRLLRGEDYKYGLVEIIRLSAFIKTHAGLKDDATTEQLINAGNDLRHDHGAAVLAQLAVQEITLARGLNKTSSQTREPGLFDGVDTANGALAPASPVRHCHIIDSIKTTAELQLLRSVYGDMLHVVGVYAPIELRIERLGRKMKDEEIYRLIDRDSGEEVEHGQRVRDTFPQADFFLRADANTTSQLEGRVRRFLDMMLGARIVTPTVAERAMYAAYSAARSSACLSRQVGAAITNAAGDILATGWNDVPKAFGGLYQSLVPNASPDDDHRCWNKDGGKCFNDEEKDLIASALIDRLADAGFLKEGSRAGAVEAVRRDSQLRGLIEFSRAVHAEMHALLNAGMSYGPQIRGGKIFVTTYPCHSCARHLVAAGISEVYFVEPYRKSLATKLHADAITEIETEARKVRIIPFDGVAPSRFLKFFSAPPGGRKSQSGRMKAPDGRPVTATTLEAIETLEALAVRGIESLATKA